MASIILVCVGACGPNLGAYGTNTDRDYAGHMPALIELTIKRREGIIKKSIFEIKSIVEDCRSQVNGGIETGLMLWESCIIPYMLCNASTWLQIKQKDIYELSKLQTLFFTQILAIQKCPTLAI